MSRRNAPRYRLTPELLLRAYAAGIFPMAESRTDKAIFWVDPRRRGVLPLEMFHVPKKLKRVVRQERFQIRCNTDFKAVIAACSEPGMGRRETWINDEILHAYVELHERGFAHSVECWHEDVLVGGLYGVSLGSAFFGESMFSRQDDASKVALVHLVARLKIGRFRLLDTQFVTDHLRQFGVIEISGREYLGLLEEALRYQAVFYSGADPLVLGEALDGLFRQSSIQTS